MPHRKQNQHVHEKHICDVGSIALPIRIAYSQIRLINTLSGRAIRIFYFIPMLVDTYQHKNSPKNSHFTVSLDVLSAC